MLEKAVSANYERAQCWTYVGSKTWGPVVYVASAKKEEKDKNELYKITSDMLKSEEPRLVAVYGESGSGKSEVCRRALKYICGIECTSLVEMCCHAPNVHNANSTRGAVLWRINNARLIQVDCYCLDLARCCAIHKNERFHLICNHQNSMRQARSALIKIGGDSSVQQFDSSITNLLRAILALGEEHVSHLEASKYLGIDASIVEEWLTTRCLEVNGKLLRTKARPKDSDRMREALAKRLYAITVHWILKQLSSQGAAHCPDFFLLDALGFLPSESPTHHTYAELVLNCVSDALDATWLSQLLKDETQLCETEHLPCAHGYKYRNATTTISNQTLLRLIDDATLKPFGETEQQVMERFKDLHQEVVRVSNSTFTVRHFQGKEASYLTSEMLVIAELRPPPSALEYLSERSETLKSVLRDFYHEDTRDQTLALRAETELDSLFELIETCRAQCLEPSRFSREVLCVSSSKTLHHYDKEHVRRQLSMWKELDSLTSQVSLPVRFSRDDFCERYSLAARQAGFIPTTTTSVETLLSVLVATNNNESHCGKNLVFLSVRLGAELENWREEVLAPACHLTTLLASLFRHRKYQRTVQALRRFVTAVKTRHQRHSAKALLKGGRALVSVAGSYINTRRSKTKLAAALKVQHWYRSVAMRRLLRCQYAKSSLMTEREYSSILSEAQLATLARQVVALYHGYRVRQGRGALAWLIVRKARLQRNGSAIAQFQATWRSILVVRRFRQVRSAARVLGRWLRARQTRQYYLIRRGLVTRIAAYGRGLLERAAARRARDAEAILEERSLLRQSREAHCCVLADAFARSQHHSTQVLDIDCRNRDFYLKLQLSGKGMVAVGREHALTLTHRGEIIDAESNKVLSPLAEQAVFALIYCGEESSCALSSQGRVFTWGSNRHGQLAQDVNRCSRPRPVLGPLLRRRVTCLSAGSYHVACVASPGYVFVWGQAHGSGQEHTKLPTQVSFGRRSSTIWKVFCGRDFTFALTRRPPGSSRRELYCWGGNQRGQLGIGSQTKNAVLKPARTCEDHAIIDVACGAHHSLVLTKSGTVLAAGANSYGQLGLGHREDRAEFEPIPSLAQAVKIKTIAAGQRHSIALAIDDEVFAWGSTLAVSVDDPNDICDTVKQDFLRFSNDRMAAALQKAYDNAHARRDWTTFCCDSPRRAPIPLGIRPVSVACANSASLSITYLSTEVHDAEYKTKHLKSLRKDEKKVSVSRTASRLDGRDKPLRNLSVPPALDLPAYFLIAEALRIEAKAPHESLFAQYTLFRHANATKCVLPASEIALSESSRGTATTRHQQRERDFAINMVKRQPAARHKSNDEYTSRVRAVLKQHSGTPPPRIKKHVQDIVTEVDRKEKSSADLTRLFADNLLLSASNPSRTSKAPRHEQQPAQLPEKIASPVKPAVPESPPLDDPALTVLIGAMNANFTSTRYALGPAAASPHSPSLAFCDTVQTASNYDDTLIRAHDARRNQPYLATPRRLKYEK